MKRPESRLGGGLHFPLGRKGKQISKREEGTHRIGEELEKCRPGGSRKLGLKCAAEDINAVCVWDPETQVNEGGKTVGGNVGGGGKTGETKIPYLFSRSGGIQRVNKG